LATQQPTNTKGRYVSVHKLLILLKPTAGIEPATC
jgi:hypothetical protein